MHSFNNLDMISFNLQPEVEHNYLNFVNIVISFVNLLLNSNLSSLNYYSVTNIIMVVVVNS